MLKHAFAIAGFFGILLVGGPSAYGFRIDTHMQIAHVVYADAVDGAVTIRTTDGEKVQLRLRPEVREALKRHPWAFFMGSVGPDAFPGVYEGQMAIHPGQILGQGKDDPQAWGSSEWATHLLNEALESRDGASIAFAYGVLTHLASDIFAHTYVNTYAGAVWNLTEGGTRVEQRHFVLEGYLARLSPWREGAKKLALERQDESRLNAMIPAEFVSRAWILDPKVEGAYKRAGMTHVVEINRLHRRLGKLAGDNGILRQVEKQVKRAFFDKYVGLPLTNEEFDELYELERRFQENFKMRGENWGQQEVHRWAREVARLSTDLQIVQNDALRARLEKVRAAAESIEPAVDAAEKAEAKFHSAERRWRKKREKIVDDVLDRAKFLPGELKRVLKQRALEKSRVLDRLEEERDKALGLRKEVREEQRRRVAAAGRALADLNEVLRTAETGLATVDKDVLRSLERLNDTSFVLVSLVEGWRDDIEEGLAEYQVANAQILRRSLLSNPAKSNASRDSWSILERWTSCGLRKIAGLGAVASPWCTASDRLFDPLETAFSELQLSVLDVGVAGGRDLGEQLETIRTDLETSLKNEIRQLVLTRLIKDDGLRDFVEVLHEEPTAEALRNAFGAESQTGLLPISDIVERVRADAGLKKSKKVSLNSFPAFVNAVTLSKLAMVDGAELNTLCRALGVAKPLYPTAKPWNVLNLVARSIDHDHQWHDAPPPYVRRSAPYPKAVASSYGRSSPNTEENGLRLWLDADARNRVFRRIFVGPLAPGLHAPAELTPPRGGVVPQDYRYRSCRADPFPDHYRTPRCPIE